MKSVLGSIAGGVAANAVFALINSRLGLVDGRAGVLAMIAVFLVFAGLSYVLLSRETLGRGSKAWISGIRTGRDTAIELSDVSTDDVPTALVADVEAGRDAEINVRGIRSR